MVIDPRLWVYDLESYPNVFTASFLHAATRSRVLFEISDWKNQGGDLLAFLNSLYLDKSFMVGFNNVGYDYPLIHHFIKHSVLHPTAYDLYLKSKSIIDTPWNNRFSNHIAPFNILIQQIDLSKIWHFDNSARMTSLKAIEFALRMDSVEDLPYKPGSTLTFEQKNILIDYNDHDVDATFDFLIETLDAIKFRYQLSDELNRDFLNASDKKIGQQYFVHMLDKIQPGLCYHKVDGIKKPRQTTRNQIVLFDLIFDYIHFENNELNRILNFFKRSIMTKTKGFFDDLTATINGFKFVFGSGGLHGSIESQSIYSDNTHSIIDIDVKSYYPNIAIKNKIYPEHIGKAFCDVYEMLYNERSKHKKGTLKNALFKLALNGVFGDSNSNYSPFYDPNYTMSITINGQLLLCMLAEHLMKIPSLQMIQANTDGVTVRVLNDQIENLQRVCYWWESFTCLELEYKAYSQMHIRDVNNYIAVDNETGELKNKGAYAYKTRLTQKSKWHPDNSIDWNQNHSALIIQKAAEALLINGANVDEFIKNHDDIHDFFFQAKTQKSNKLMWGDKEIQRSSRYYVALQGEPLHKIAPPAKGNKVGAWCRAPKVDDSFYEFVLMEIDEQPAPPDAILDINGRPWDERINTKNKSQYKIRGTAHHKGYVVQLANDITDIDRGDDWRININYQYYIDEAYKLINPLKS